jgi:hypothetical protein
MQTPAFSLLLALLCTPLLSAADLTPRRQGAYSQVYADYPRTEDQYPNGINGLPTGNVGEMPVNLSVILKYDVSQVPLMFQSATLTLDCFYTNPEPSNTGGESVDHFYVLEAFTSENGGDINYDDAESTDVERVGKVTRTPKEVSEREPVAFDVTAPLAKARKSGWKSLAFRIVETDSKGEPMNLPEKEIYGSIFRPDPVLSIK